jgi:predicted DNA-binding transcriptional regulator AlpA
MPSLPFHRRSLIRRTTIRAAEIAELLGVTKQRAHQIAEEKGFPAPPAEDTRGRVWSRYEVQAWARRWRREKPWR